MGLSFDVLRAANVNRLPTFKNSLGQPAHTQPDGSDWTPAQWLQAVTGELGEYANTRKKFERGDITAEKFKELAAEELADFITYADILAFRLDIDLGKSVKDKFNKKSREVGASIVISDGGEAVIRETRPGTGAGDIIEGDYSSNAFRAERKRLIDYAAELEAKIKTLEDENKHAGNRIGNRLDSREIVTIENEYLIYRCKELQRERDGLKKALEVEQGIKNSYVISNKLMEDRIELLQKEIGSLNVVIDSNPYKSSYERELNSRIKLTRENKEMSDELVGIKAANKSLKDMLDKYYLE